MSVSVTSSLGSAISLDIYPPQLLLEEDDSSLVILILQGVEIDKSEYSAIAIDMMTISNASQKPTFLH
jgi:hypothetical protein